LHGRIVEDLMFALVGEFGQAEFLDFPLAVEAEALFDVDFDPETLAVESVLPAFVFALHGVVTLVKVFVGAAPGVVNAHGVVGGDGTVDKAEDAVLFFGFGAQAAQFVERVGFLPVIEDVIFEFYEVYFVGYVFKAHNFSPFRMVDFGFGIGERPFPQFLSIPQVLVGERP